MSIEIIHPTMADLIDPSAQLDRIGDGFKFTEGPVWHKEQQCLYFSDIPANILYKWTEQDGFSAHREPSQNTNGLTINAKGQLISCEHSGRRVSIEIVDEVDIEPIRLQAPQTHLDLGMDVTPRQTPIVGARPHATADL